MQYTDPIVPKILDENTPFCDGEEALTFRVLDFWRWGFSSITDNTLRGVIAEYLVATAVGCTEKVREEWKSYDLDAPDGTKIEVKSAAYIQTWRQESRSSIMFYYPKSFGWNKATNQLEGEKKRHADVYIFSLLAERDKAKVNPLDVSQWEFYVVSTWKLDERVRSQSCITLPSFKELECDCTSYTGLSDAIKRAAKSQREHLSK